MPFYPAELVYLPTDKEKVVEFYDAPNGPSPWEVNYASIGSAVVDWNLFTFDNVGAHPDPRKNRRWMQGTLKFDAEAALKQDATLAANWIPGTALVLSVGCGMQPRSLTIILS